MPPGIREQLCPLQSSLRLGAHRGHLPVLALEDLVRDLTPHTKKPPCVTDASVCQIIVEPAVIKASCGPGLPRDWYRMLPIWRKSKYACDATAALHVEGRGDEKWARAAAAAQMKKRGD